MVVGTTRPGLCRVADSTRAPEWSDRLGRAIHEVKIQTNAWTLWLICHDLQVERLAVGDPATGELKDLEGT